MTFGHATQLGLATLVILSYTSHCLAQTQCSATLTGTINNNVECSGNCILDGATVNGNVVCSTGTLLAKGSATINGGVTLSGLVTSVELQAVTITGTVLVSSASSLTKLTVTSDANISSLTATNTPGDFDLAGLITGITLTDSGDLVANSLTSTGGVTVTGGDGVVDICGSTITGLTLQQRMGNVVIDATLVSCGATSLSGGFSATKGTGDVTVKGADFSSSDFIVSEYKGDVVLEDAQVSDILISKNEGSLTITNADADSDTSITEQDGSVDLTDVKSLGDFLVSSVTENVVFQDSDFGLEDAVFAFIDGTVTISDNINFSLEVKESEGLVTINNNSITNASINKNKGGVSIMGNTITTLSCSDNNPAPTGSGNTVTFPNGQCSSGFP